MVAGRNCARLEASGFPFVEMDVADADSVNEGVRRVAPIDIFVSNAGAARTAPSLRTERALWDEMIAVNLTGAYHCARAAIPSMIERGWGRFMVIASTAALKGYAYAGAYAAAKHGVLGWVRTLAVEHAKTGVTCNAICPGYTDTPMVAEAVERIAAKTGKGDADAKRALAARNPMGRMIGVDEVAAAALWLASDAAASVNGQAIVVDGGELAS